MSCVVALTTVPSDFDVDALAAALLEEGLAACVNVLPTMRSVYRWNGAIERAEERQVVLKTTPERIDALEQALKERHPYEVPEFLVLPVARSGEAYLAWVDAETAGPRRGSGPGS